MAEYEKWEHRHCKYCSYEQSRVAHLIEPLVSIHSHLRSQRFSQNQHIAWHSTIWPGIKKKEHTQTYD